MELVHNIEKSIEELRHSDQYWSSFIEKESFEAGSLRLGPGEKDNQSPHKSDEIYLIIAGDGYINIDGKDFEIKKNHSYFVPKTTPHYFHGNNKEILAFYVLN
ncbi:MAG: cupin domain-containing protein [Candidatus Heimdallarchaeota archaeon]|nr:cupin domain-containing protein [Candidatus Heimdallarchaeota archaeon]